MTRPALPAPAVTLVRPHAPRCRGGASTLLRVARAPRPGRLAARFAAAQTSAACVDPQPGFIAPLQPSAGVLTPRFA